MELLAGRVDLAAVNRFGCAAVQWVAAAGNVETLRWLQRRGVEYIEIRALDLNPFEPVGINQQEIRFLDLFATYCLLRESPRLEHCDLDASKENLRRVVYDGRNTGVQLNNWGKSVSLRNWGLEKLD